MRISLGGPGNSPFPPCKPVFSETSQKRVETRVYPTSLQFVLSTDLCSRTSPPADTETSSRRSAATKQSSPSRTLVSLTQWRHLDLLMPLHDLKPQRSWVNV